MGGPITPGTVTVSKTFTCVPERLTAGFLHIIVKHDNDDTPEPDTNYAYSSHWNSGGVDTLTIDLYGGGLSYVPTTTYATTTDGNGSGCTITVDTVGSMLAEILTFTIATAGSGYKVGDSVEIPPINPLLPTADANFTVTTVTGGTVSPNDVPTDGDYPFLDINPVHPIYGAEPNYAGDFRDSRNVLVSNTPELPTDATDANVEKNLSMGDHDCFLFYVTCGAHLESYYYPSGTVKKTYNGNPYYSKSEAHDKCQSFVKSHLISRINNVRNTLNDGNSDESMWKQGIPTNKYFADEIKEGAGWDETDSKLYGTPAHNTGIAEEYLITNGVYKHTGFGIDLTTKSTFFTPVWNIDIYASHEITPTTKVEIPGVANPHSDGYPPGDNFWYPAGGTHDTDTFDLKVDIHLWAYDTGGTKYAFNKNRVNVFWQPFGETSEYELA